MGVPPTGSAGFRRLVPTASTSSTAALFKPFPLQEVERPSVGRNGCPAGGSGASLRDPIFTWGSGSATGVQTYHGWCWIGGERVEPAFPEEATFLLQATIIGQGNGCALGP
ncbi:hypothetical protein NFI96_033568 [Prochilodus magdalenae]|nr:hypothetical protein NFI96_033568 [Prochilodus magdalenae]